MGEHLPVSSHTISSDFLNNTVAKGGRATGQWSPPSELPVEEI